MLIPYKVLISDRTVGNPTLTQCVKFSLPVGFGRNLRKSHRQTIIYNPTSHTKGGDYSFTIKEPIAQSSSSQSQTRMEATFQ